MRLAILSKRAKYPKILVGLIILSVLAVLFTIPLKFFGTRYLENQLQQQLTQAGLMGLVHYSKLNLDLFSLTVSLNDVSLGRENAPWIRLHDIHFKHILLNYPDLDINFTLENSDQKTLSRKTRLYMALAGINVLQGQGYIKSKIKGDELDSNIQLQLNQSGTLQLASRLSINTTGVTLETLRSDLLASLALGQPEAMVFLYGDNLRLKSLKLQYQEEGLVQRYMTSFGLNKGTRDYLVSTIDSGVSSLGLAPWQSPAAKEIANTLTDFLLSPNRLQIALLPPSYVTLNELSAFLTNKTFYSNTNMKIEVE